MEPYKTHRPAGNGSRYGLAPACLLAALLYLVMPASPAQAAGALIREIISVHPGEQQARELVVFDKFNLAELSPVEGFIVYSWGYAVPAGDMTIELSCLADAEFRERIGFSLVMAGYSRKQSPVLRWKWALFPDTATVTVPVQSTFGIYYIGVLINSLRGYVDRPVPFSIVFSVTEGSAAPESLMPVYTR